MKNHLPQLEKPAGPRNGARVASPWSSLPRGHRYQRGIVIAQQQTNMLAAAPSPFFGTYPDYAGAAGRSPAHGSLFPEAPLTLVREQRLP